MKNKKVIYAIMGVFALLLAFIAVTYAYWAITKNQVGSNTVSTTCLNITLEDAESDNTGINLQNQFPISDSEGAALKPYKFTLTNNCAKPVDYQIALESIGDSTTALSASSIKVKLDSDEAILLSSSDIVAPTFETAYISHKLGMGRLAKSGDTGSSVTHELRLWIDEATLVSEANKTFSSKISVTIGQDIVKPAFEEGSLAYTLIEAAGGEETITELESTAFANATTASDAGMYKAMDDYGTSYYYRGNVTNNYVKFGSYAAGSQTPDGMVSEDTPLFWRIIRINGDGTIRMIFDGTEKLANGEDRPTAWVGNNSYNSNDQGKPNAGYMIGTELDPYGDNSETELSDSTMKSEIDAWYVAHLKTKYESYIADSLFCNDKTESHSGKNEFNEDVIYYESYNRIVTEHSPVLTCSNKRDRFTVDDTTIGNGRLTHPVGPISVDELVMAGYSYGKETVENYIIDDFWTGTPVYLLDSYYQVYAFEYGGNNLYETDVNSSTSFNAVINLKADVDFTIDEDGTYVITTN